MIKEKFDPSNVMQYAGKTISSQSGSVYYITNDRRFKGRPSIDGAEILLIGGITDAYFKDALKGLDTSKPNSKDTLDNVIIKHARKISPGLRLVLSLTNNSAKEKRRNGFISGYIADIE